MTKHPKRILVAEDNSAMLNVIRLNLSRAGFEVVTAKCGKTAWKLLQENAFDLVVTDFQMPGMTGGELCERIRGHEGLGPIPVILLTAKGFELDAAYYERDLRVAAIVDKPFSPRELVRTVREYLAVGVTDA